MSKTTRERIGDVFRQFITDDAEMAALLGGEPILTALSIDSLTMLKLITELEVQFEKRFDMESIEQAVETIDSLADFLDS